MIILDTNVVSEAMKPEPHPTGRAWLNDQVAETLYLSSETLAELLFSTQNPPVMASYRRKQLANMTDSLVVDRDLIFLQNALIGIAIVPRWD